MSHLEQEQGEVYGGRGGAPDEALDDSEEDIEEPRP